MTARGLFITVEGGDGTGKSTLISGLKSAFDQKGQPVRITREPGGTGLAEAVRSLVLMPQESGSWSALSQTLLVYAARRDHLEKLILPAVDAGEVVICDRFADSTRVYQGLSGADQASIDALDALVVGNNQPDLTLVLDGPVEDLFARRQTRGVSDVFEAKSLDFHKKVRQAYLDIAKRFAGRCRVLDAMAPPEDVLAQAIEHIEEARARHER